MTMSTIEVIAPTFATRATRLKGQRTPHVARTKQEPLSGQQIRRFAEVSSVCNFLKSNFSDAVVTDYQAYKNKN